jgi:hypothetical protein
MFNQVMNSLVLIVRWATRGGRPPRCLARNRAPIPVGVMPEQRDGQESKAEQRNMAREVCVNDATRPATGLLSRCLSTLAGRARQRSVVGRPALSTRPAS